MTESLMSALTSRSPETMHNPLFSDSHLLDFWRGVIDPQGVGMPEAIAGEIGDYTGEAVAEVLAKMATGKEDFRDLWLSLRIDATDSERIAQFYTDQFAEAYELANWHCGRTNGEPPLNYAYAAALADHLKARRVLDFGSGIGSGALAFASVGCDVSCADIATQLQGLLRHRLAVRGYRPTLIDLSRGDRPTTEAYDLIACFDVLEHVPDQLDKLRELESYLSIGGYLVINLLPDSTDADRPMHISSAGNWLKLIRQTGLNPCWPLMRGETQVLVRTRLGRLRNLAARSIDLVQGR